MFVQLSDTGEIRMCLPWHSPFLWVLKCSRLWENVLDSSENTGMQSRDFNWKMCYKSKDMWTITTETFGYCVEINRFQYRLGKNPTNPTSPSYDDAKLFFGVAIILIIIYFVHVHPFETLFGRDTISAVEFHAALWKPLSSLLTGFISVSL